MNPNAPRVVARLVLAGALCLMLACAPGFGDDPQNPQPIVITSNWQCPTPSPEPTRQVGDDPTPAPPPEATYVPGQEPTAAPIFSTPAPTATPYVRTGSDYFIGQRIDVQHILHLMVTQYRTQAGPTADTAYHLVTIQIENDAPTALPIFFDLGTLRNVTRPDGRAVAGIWTHDEHAARQLGISPSRDPDVQMDTDGPTSGGYPPGTTTRTLVFVAPAGQAQAWGMNFVDDGPTVREDGAGEGQVWFLLRSDTNCTQGPGGGAGSGGAVPPPGSPSVGSGSWPVPLDAVITRGYGCHSLYTGVHGNCGGDAPWWHDGIDFAKPVGAPLYATRAMTILYAGRDTSTMDCSFFAPANDPPYTGFGQYVKTQDSSGFTYWYGHVNRWRVQTGDQVVAGQQIADMGKTGCSTGSHLHFRVRLNGVDRNPLEVISR